MKQQIILGTTALVALAASAFTSAPVKKADPSAIYFKNAINQCVVVASTFINYFTTTSASNQAQLRSASGALKNLWGSNVCEGTGNIPVYFQDPNN